MSVFEANLNGEVVKVRVSSLLKVLENMEEKHGSESVADSLQVFQKLTMLVFCEDEGTVEVRWKGYRHDSDVVRKVKF